MLRRIFDYIIDSKKSFFSTFYIISLIILTSYLIYVTGGTAFAYTHMMYIPVIISAFFYNVKGSLVTAFLAGIALGPHMPMNVSEGIMQEPGSWIIRTCFFILMGLIISLLLKRIKKDRDIQIENSYLNVTTGFPNINKLKIDLNELIHNSNEFSIITFKIINLDQINRYVDYSIGDKSIFVVIDALAEFFNINSIYSIFNDELCVVMPGSSIEYAYAKSSEFLDCFKEPVHVDGLPVDINIISSISNFPMHGNNAREVFKNAGKALDQEIIDENGISIYDKSISKKCQQKYETIVSLYNAIKNDKFTLVYQPKINLKKNEVMGVEALLRWNDGNIGNMNVAEFIKIAEETGIIDGITKWVIRNAVYQLKKWQEEGLETKIAINISSNDLKDDSIIEYTRKCIKENQVDSTLLEFELTERCIIENENKVEHLLNRIRDTGLKISLDDFGTGYNSLIHLVNLPIDYIKIDKSFVDNINDVQNKFLIEDLISMAHDLGKEIIAEGAETQEQIELLIDMDCDHIQGYYFSKPLPPDKIKNFILDFKKFRAVYTY